MPREMPREATLYRMVTDDHVCPYGLKAKDLLERRGYEVDDRHLETRDQTDRFKKRHQVETTPQVFLDGERVGGYESLRRFFGLDTADGDETSYQPVIAVCGMAAAMSLAASWATLNSPFTVRAIEWFVAFSMCILAILKLRDLESFSSQFLSYDLLARRWVRYAYLYPFAEAFAGVGMIAETLPLLVAPVALFVGAVGAVSVIRAVYVEGRELKCACVGGDSNVPLGFVSLSENLMMVAMAFWMLGKIFIT